jgi:hypothetical protein
MTNDALSAGLRPRLSADRQADAADRRSPAFPETFGQPGGQETGHDAVGTVGRSIIRTSTFGFHSSFASNVGGSLRAPPCPVSERPDYTFVSVPPWWIPLPDQHGLDSSSGVSVLKRKQPSPWARSKSRPGDAGPGRNGVPAQRVMASWASPAACVYFSNFAAGRGQALPLLTTPITYWCSYLS